MKPAHVERLRELFKEIGSDIVKIRWDNTTPAQRKAVGKVLGRASKAAWANMTADERSQEMVRRAQVREENRRKREQE